MKPVLCLFSLLVASPLLTVASSGNRVALAQCVVTDVGIQVAVHGSQQPAQQVNDVAIEQPQQCRGNTINSRGTQVYVGGTEPVRQERRVRHQLNSEPVDQNRRQPIPVPDGPTVIVPVGVQVDVYNAAEQLRD
jgi:hypothetical protein